MDAALAVNGLMIQILADHDVGQEARAGSALGNGSARSRGLGDGVALCAGKSWTHMTDQLDARRHVFEHFGDIFSQALPGTAAIRATSGMGYV